ncbi:hypothetical protein AALP_AA5G093400 [Arabis alpina]|uniref:3-oxoacyl-[acyl-carrier-protein] reductase n=1 Tax=Arabis alpina TaxID=50452 RepID=A0A087GVY2_ARAAL|nr:hypothetical protein AALP_AA5G093400 [Arabis alpina]
MDMLNTILNFLFPPLTIIFLFLFYPFYLLIKLGSFLKKHFRFENVAGKVVLITGASSGIGEHVAYEYAKKGAYLALVARRKDRLEIVAETSRQLGSGNVIIIPGDVAKLEDCKKFIDETILHFGKLDHLINNAGVFQTVVFEDFTQIQDANPIMDINFWGATYITYFAIPHLRKSRGKIIVITSGAAYIQLPLASVYAASKAALLRFFETLRIELSPDIKITIVFPGVVSTDMTTPHYIEKYGSDFILSESVSECAKSIFRGIGRGETTIEEPSWIKWLILMKNMCPEIVDYALKYLFFRYLKPYFKLLITGASSGIGEHVAYEYAKKGACLALVARRKDHLEIVAETSRQLGSGDVIIISGDVSKVEDCKKFIDVTIHHFGKLDHLINNAGVSQKVIFEDFTQIQDANPIMDINFWGSTYITYFAIPHLRKSKGRIIVISSALANMPWPTGSVYAASKAALLRFFETLRIELSPDIKITIVLPGVIATNMITPHFIEKSGSEFILSESVSKCAKAIFKVMVVFSLWT